MSSYLGRHAEYYDIFYADKSYKQEAEFVHQCIQRFQIGQTSRVLELACGTGSHAMQLAKKGYDILATDYSKDMLEQARKKLPYVEGKLRFEQQDMRQLTEAEQKFDVVLILFDSIGYVQTNESIDDVLQGVSKQLRSGGLFIFEFWHAAAMLRNFDPLRVRRWQMPGVELLRISETELEIDRQLAHVSYTIYELREDKTYDFMRETQTNRYFLKREMQLFLQKNNFMPLKWYAGFEENDEINDDTWHILAVTRWKGN